MVPYAGGGSFEEAVTKQSSFWHWIYCIFSSRSAPALYKFKTMIIYSWHFTLYNESLLLNVWHCRSVSIINCLRIVQDVLSSKAIWVIIWTATWNILVSVLMHQFASPSYSSDHFCAWLPDRIACGIIFLLDTSTYNPCQSVLSILHKPIGRFHQVKNSAAQSLTNQMSLPVQA